MDQDSRRFAPPTTLLTHETVFRLLVRNFTVLPSFPRYLSLVRSHGSFEAGAFSACLRNHSCETGVELLAQGRGVFWSQLTRLRSPLVVAFGPAGKTLANGFTRLTSLVRKALD